MDDREYGLGRLYVPDERDHQYPFRLAFLAPPAVPSFRFWRTNKQVLDQNGWPQCVAYAWKHWLTSSPLQQGKNVDTAEVYRAAQIVDEWPGENYDGTSVRAGAKVLRERGFIGNYLWATTVDEVKNWVLVNGPVVVGTNWYSHMTEGISVEYPLRGFWVKPEGTLLGGHAYLISGYSLRMHAFRILNSWGTAWGERGKAWLAEEYLEQLMLEDGEVCTAVEQHVALSKSP